MTPIKACRFETFGLIEAPWHKRGRGGVGGRAPLLKCIMGETQETECKHAHAHSGMHAWGGGAGEAPAWNLRARRLLRCHFPAEKGEKGVRGEGRKGKSQPSSTKGLRAVCAQLGHVRRGKKRNKTALRASAEILWRRLYQKPRAGSVGSEHSSVSCRLTVKGLYIMQYSLPQI